MTDDSTVPIPIEHGIPIPQKQQRSGLITTVRQMKTGDSIILPKSQRGTIYSLARYLRIKIAVRAIPGTDQVRAWKISDFASNPQNEQAEA